MDNNYFAELNGINVSGKTEKKNGLTYLSWAWAWGELKKLFPDATYTIYENKDGLFYHTDGRTCWVKTGVTVNGIEHIEYLPVMDNRNRAIPLEQVNSFDVNKAIQRSLTKAVARHGLGLYIYAGEDIPEDVKDEQRATEAPTETIYDCQRQRAADAPIETIYVCQRCKHPITPVIGKDGTELDVKTIIEFSQKHHGKNYCAACQQELRNGK